MPPTSQQRFTAARTYLVAAHRELSPVVEAAHPNAAKCLPIPPISVPNTIADIRTQLDMLAANLFDPKHHGTHRQWITAWNRCTHLDREHAIALKELYYRWYQLLAAVWHRVDDRPVPGSAADIEERSKNFFYWLQQYPAGGRRHDR